MNDIYAIKEKKTEVEADIEKYIRKRIDKLLEEMEGNVIAYYDYTQSDKRVLYSNIKLVFNKDNEEIILSGK